jgi:hypothetical protein
MFLLKKAACSDSVNADTGAGARMPISVGAASVAKVTAATLRPRSGLPLRERVIARLTIRLSAPMSAGRDRSQRARVASEHGMKRRKGVFEKPSPSALCALARSISVFSKSLRCAGHGWSRARYCSKEDGPVGLWRFRSLTMSSRPLRSRLMFV